MCRHIAYDIGPSPTGTIALAYDDDDDYVWAWVNGKMENELQIGALRMNQYLSTGPNPIIHQTRV